MKRFNKKWGSSFFLMEPAAAGRWVKWGDVERAISEYEKGTCPEYSVTCPKDDSIFNYNSCVRCFFMHHEVEETNESE